MESEGAVNIKTCFAQYFANSRVHSYAMTTCILTHPKGVSCIFTSLDEHSCHVESESD